MDIYIPRYVKAGTSRQRSTNPRPNVNVLGLYQKLGMFFFKVAVISKANLLPYLLNF